MSEAQAPPEPDYRTMENHVLLEALKDDAYKWATAFCQHFPDTVGHETMIGWFANAIEVSHTHRVRQMAKLPEVRNPAGMGPPRE